MQQPHSFEEAVAQWVQVAREEARRLPKLTLKLLRTWQSQKARIPEREAASSTSKHCSRDLRAWRS